MSTDRVERVRAAVTRGPLPVLRERRSTWPVAGAAAILIAVVSMVALFTSHRPPTAQAPRPNRATINVLELASYWVIRPQPDEIVRLVEGTIEVDVDHLEPGERFRVVTKDAEIEVRGTTFEVTALGDRLEEVRVLRGVVEVRSGDDSAVLRDGERWKRPRPVVIEPSSRPELEREPLRPRKERRRVARTPSVAADPPASERSRGTQYEAAWSAFRNEDFVEAADRFARAASDEDEEPVVREEARYFLAVALARSNRSDAAMTVLETFTSEHPSSPRRGEAFAMLGWMRLDRGDDARATDAFQSALREGSARAKRSAESGLERIRRASRP
jgi:hypothetical protein